MRFAVFVEHFTAEPFQRRQAWVERPISRRLMGPILLALTGAYDARGQGADRTFGQHVGQVEVVARIQHPAVVRIYRAAAHRVSARNELVVEFERELDLDVIGAAGTGDLR